MDRSRILRVRAAACLILLLVATLSAMGAERFLHVRAVKARGGESSRLDVPVAMAAAILPGIHQGALRGGKIRIGTTKINGVDLRALLDAAQNAPEGLFVTLQNAEHSLQVAKSSGTLLIDAREGGPGSAVAHIRVPVPVVEALLSAGKDELDLVAALKALEQAGDTELVEMKDPRETIRVWVDGTAQQ
jgi:hypothetical protein